MGSAKSGRFTRLGEEKEFGTQLGAVSFQTLFDCLIV